MIHKIVTDKVAAAAAQVIKARTEEVAQIYHAAEHKEYLTDGYWQERYKAEMRLHAAVALWDAFLDVQKMPPLIVVEKIVVERSRKMYYEMNYGP